MLWKRKRKVIWKISLEKSLFSNVEGCKLNLWTVVYFKLSKLFLVTYLFGCVKSQRAPWNRIHLSECPPLYSLTLHSNFYKYCRISYFQVFPEKLINLDNLVKKNYQFLLEKKLEWTFVCKANVGQNYCFGPNCLQSINMQGSLISNITWMISNQFHIWHTDKHPKNKESEALTLHKKWSFPLRISTVKVTKSQCPVDLVTFLNTSLMVNFIFCAVLIGYPWSSIAIIQSYCSTYRSETSPQLMVGSF